jgi:hypothetical protein
LSEMDAGEAGQHDPSTAALMKLAQG